MAKNDRLNILKREIPYPSLFADATNFTKINGNQILEFLEWVSTVKTESTPLLEKDYETLSTKYKIKTGKQIFSAERFATLLIFQGCEINRAELQSDLETVGFNKDYIETVIASLEKIWEKIDPILKRLRFEAIPSLFSLRWRVDVRYGSSNYLRKPEAVAIIRIGTTDRDKSNHIHLELDLEKLSWLESVVVQVKSELLKANERVSK
jgi:hypothetical protein